MSFLLKIKLSDVFSMRAGLLKKSVFFLSLLLVLIILPTEARARRIDYFAKPQIGIWFGILTPVYTTADDVATALGGGGFFRYTLPWPSLKVGLEGSYQHFGPKGMDGVNTLTLVPVYGNFLYRIPSPPKLPLIFQLKAGAGGSWVKIRPDRVDQWDPVGMIGFEGSFPAGRLVNIGLRIDYLLIYEQHIEGARRNGHIINTGITLYFNI
jgi:hypothetical protein